MTYDLTQWCHSTDIDGRAQLRAVLRRTEMWVKKVKQLHVLTMFSLINWNLWLFLSVLLMQLLSTEQKSTFTEWDNLAFGQAKQVTYHFTQWCLSTVAISISKKQASIILGLASVWKNCTSPSLSYFVESLCYQALDSITLCYQRLTRSRKIEMQYS